MQTPPPSDPQTVPSSSRTDYPIRNAPWREWLQLFMGFGLTFLFFYMMAPFVLAILIGAVLAILAYPAYLKVKTKTNEPVAAFAVTTGMTIGVLAPLAFVLYTAIYRMFTIVNRMKLVRDGQAVEGLAEHPITKKVILFAAKWVPIDQDWLHEQALDLLQTILEKLSGSIATFLTNMPGLLLAFAVMVLSTYFFLVDGHRFLKFLENLSPLKPDRSRELYSTFERTCRGVVMGLFLSAIAQALIMTILFILCELPNPFLIGLITIICGMVPVVGASPIWIGAALYLASGSLWGKFVLIIIGGLIVSTVDNVVRPWVMKGQSEMHPFLALVSVFGAVRLMGPTGIFLGPIIAAVFVSFLKILMLELRRENLTD